MEQNLQQSLALLWRRVLRTNSTRLFGDETKRLQSRNWGDLLAQPGFVGPNYKTGGLVFVSMNPGGGPNEGLGRFDLEQYQILKQLRNCSKSDAANHFSEFNALLQRLIPRGDIGGPIFHNFLDPVLHQARIDFPSVAYLNLLKWRTKESNGLNKLYDLSWQDHTGDQFNLLKPQVVIAVGVDAGKAFQRHHTNHAYFHAIHRVIGNNIGKEGRDDIRKIGAWFKKHPLRTS